MIVAVGFDRGDIELVGITYDEMRRGCFEPQARLADMDLDGVEAVGRIHVGEAIAYRGRTDRASAAA